LALKNESKTSHFQWQTSGYRVKSSGYPVISSSNPVHSGRGKSETSFKLNSGKKQGANKSQLQIQKFQKPRKGFDFIFSKNEYQDTKGKLKRGPSE